MIYGKVALLLELLGLLLVSTIVNQNQRNLPIAAEKSSKYYSNRKGSQVIEVDSENRCHVFENGHATWILTTRMGRVALLNYIQFQILLQKCQWDTLQQAQHGMGQSHFGDGSSKFSDENDLNQNIIEAMWNDTRPNDISPGFDINSELFFNETDVSHFMGDLGNSTENSTSSGLPLIFPGTLWCGRGDIASSRDDIGLYVETDKCCREHDHCPENILAKQTKYGLRNDGDYTKSHCDCDNKFRKCLENDQSVSSLTSFKIANVYFNLLKPQCFDMKHPVELCERRRLSGECIAFRYDNQQPLKWQFFPAQPYIVRPARGLFDTIVYGNSEFTRPPSTSIPPPSFPDPFSLPGIGENGIPKPPVPPGLAHIKENILDRL